MRSMKVDKCVELQNYSTVESLGRSDYEYVYSYKKASDITLRPFII